MPESLTDEKLDADLWLLRKIAAALQDEYQVAEGLARAILIVLETRGLGMDEDARDRLLATMDLDLLDIWLRRALTATTADEVLQP